MAQPMQKSSSANFLVDLLTGEDPLPHPLAQPVTENVVSKESDTLDFLDLAVGEYHSVETNHNISSAEDGRSDTGAVQYLSCLKSLTGPSLVCCYIINVSLSIIRFVVLATLYNHLLVFI